MVSIFSLAMAVAIVRDLFSATILKLKLKTFQIPRKAIRIILTPTRILIKEKPDWGLFLYIYINCYIPLRSQSFGGQVAEL